MLITFEGLDYSGKSTQAKLLNDYLNSCKIKSILVREPGGTQTSEKIREILLNKKHLNIKPSTEFFLFSAARSQLVNEVIKPNLKKKIVVICDRYYDSSTAYQGYGGKLDVKEIIRVNDFATAGLKPDLTFFIDLAPDEAFKRAGKNKKSRDRMEEKGKTFYNNVYKGFKTIARKYKKRFVVIDGRKRVEEIHRDVVKVIVYKMNLSFLRRQESD
jgi:dTMP kinase